MKRSSRRAISRQLAARLNRTVIQRRRETVYKMLLKRHSGKVPCFVCGEHVEKKDATLEHVKPRSLGGGDETSNLSISHCKCNQARGNDVNYVAPRRHCEKAER